MDDLGVPLFWETTISGHPFLGFATPKQNRWFLRALALHRPRKKRESLARNGCFDDWPTKFGLITSHPSMVINIYIHTLHYITLHDITLHYIIIHTLHDMTCHYITFYDRLPGWCDFYDQPGNPN